MANIHGFPFGKYNIGKNDEMELYVKSNKIYIFQVMESGAYEEKIHNLLKSFNK